MSGKAGRPRDPIRVGPPVVKHLLRVVAESGLSDAEILDRAGLQGAALHRLRSGSRGGRLMTIASIAEVVGLELRLAPIERGQR